MSRVDKNLFEGEHYLGRPADFDDKIITRRIALTKAIPDFCGKNYDLADIGCGNGASSFLLADEMRSCTGLEVFDSHRAAFEAYKKQHHINNVHFKLFNVETEKSDRLYDRFISFEVIEHLSDDKNVKGYFDLLKPGGIGAISVPNKWWIFETHGAKLPLLPWNRVPFFSWLPRPIHERYANARIYTQSRIKNLLSSVGFIVEKVEYITAPMDVLPNGAFKKYLQNSVFKNDSTKVPMLATAIFVVVRKPL